MEIKTFRTSTILVATGGKTSLYKSRAEMTPALRQQMQRTLNSPMAATILIADQRGRDEILKLLRGETSALRGASGKGRRLHAGVHNARRAVLPRWLLNPWLRALVAFLIPALAGAAFYALITSAR